jgi:hypothetical protein
MEGVAAGQRTRAVASSHHLLTYNALRFILKRSFHKSVGEMPLPQRLNCARYNVGLLADCNKGGSSCRAQHPRVFVSSGSLAIAQCTHVSGNLLSREKHSLR